MCVLENKTIYLQHLFAQIRSAETANIRWNILDLKSNVSVTQDSDASLRELYSAKRYYNISLDYKRGFLVFVCYPFFVVKFP
jgi:hypothetical protein